MTSSLQMQAKFFPCSNYRDSIDSDASQLQSKRRVDKQYVKSAMCSRSSSSSTDWKYWSGWSTLFFSADLDNSICRRFLISTRSAIRPAHYDILVRAERRPVGHKWRDQTTETVVRPLSFCVCVFCSSWSKKEREKKKESTLSLSMSTSSLGPFKMDVWAI